MEGTYIKLYRDLLKKPIMQNPKLLQVWIWCLLKASHCEHFQTVGLQKIHLLPGQFITGRFAGAKELNINPSSFWKYLTWLKNNESLDIKSNNKFSVITLTNWHLHQMDTPKGDSKNDNKKTTKRQQNDTNNNGNNGNNNISPYGDISNDLAQVVDAFVEMRKKIKKPMTDRAIAMMLNKLHKMAQTDSVKLTILERSIINSWQDIYDLPEVKNGQPQQRTSGNSKPNYGKHPSKTDWNNEPNSL